MLTPHHALLAHAPPHTRLLNPTHQSHAPPPRTPTHTQPRKPMHAPRRLPSHTQAATPIHSRPRTLKYPHARLLVPAGRATFQWLRSLLPATAPTTISTAPNVVAFCTTYQPRTTYQCAHHRGAACLACHQPATGAPVAAPFLLLLLLRCAAKATHLPPLGGLLRTNAATTYYSHTALCANAQAQLHLPAPLLSS